MSNGTAVTNGGGGVNLSNRCVANNNNIAKTNINGITTTNTSTNTKTTTTTTARNQVPGGVVQLQQQQQQMPLKAISWNYAIDVWWDKIMAEASTECEPVWVDAEDPLFILYTR